ncbi:HipA domain-containing protein [Listeria costaricensis]|uniref:HipA domain-containing protein n=1 Tax=Listeria costaricensis TaxID=2026604 RepID=UPI000C07BB49|nr:HipA domain-containing protein [Listeria costaricensis]
MQIVDVSDWQEVDIWTTGKRVKTWLEKDRTRYLFKIPKTSGEITAEMAAYLIGTNCYKLHLPETYIAIKNEQYGTLSKNFVNKNANVEFIEAGDYFFQKDPSFDPTDLSKYQIKTAIEFMEDMCLKRPFYEMLLFDYLIANQDRHAENWGILINNRNQKYLAPIYDNGSSLFNGLSE